MLNIQINDLVKLEIFSKPYVQSTSGGVKVHIESFIGKFWETCCKEAGPFVNLI